ncbi:hypothetical protein GF337_04465, partial [candidate division KSB1 bacterium]|nr:hypothetical protein [candidate division KSB1 bacterium]
EAADKIFEHLKSGIDSEAKGVAIYARGGNDPFFLALQFRVPVENSILFESTPVIYPLIQLKDTYHSFVVVISTEERVRILGVNLGEITESIWTERPELRKRVGREWTKEHYQNHREHRRDKFIKEKVKVIDQLMANNGYSHLILAGNATTTARLKNALPKHLQEKLIDSITIDEKAKTENVIESTLASFIEQEQKESLEAVEMLKREINTNCLAVVGAEDTLKALEAGQVDMLLIDQDYKDDASKEEMIKMAVNTGTKIEFVTDNETLRQIGGVGCLLRYRIPGQYESEQLCWGGLE